MSIAIKRMTLSSVLGVFLSLAAFSASAQEMVDFRTAIDLSSNAVVQVDFAGDDLDDRIAMPRMRRADLMPQAILFGLADQPRFPRAGFAISGTTVVTPLPAAVTDVSVTTTDGAQYDGKVIVRDNVTGLAVVQLENASFISLPLDFNAAQAGLPVVASWIGSEGMISDAGMVASAPGASEPALGFTSSIDFGESMQAVGSPVVNANGSVVGVMVQGPSGGLHCVSATQVNRLIDASLGENPIDLKRGLVGIQFDSNEVVSVAGVSPGSAADTAGLKVGDQIVSINERRMDSVQQVLAAVAEARSGDSLSLVVQRGDEVLNKTLTLTEHPQQVAANPQPRVLGQRGGFKLQDGRLVPLDGDDAAVPVPQLPGGLQQWMADPNGQAMPPIFWGQPIEGLQVERSHLEDTLQDMKKRLDELNERLKDKDDKGGE
ncbi:S1C family serine protease [Stieleria varia]|uniref:Periplasmic pH-dependent serine endoprotease DegQ n=1 Tax=Stieleria varia TaxID=2528005 RepID=A0A5C6B9T8_9BACT|nr:S1C family serine protease [Stieleria varia]TWU08201.1 Periplasmic pH-dependent serine endoprotease DegQ precursor [Stieleria varia]